MKAWFGVLGRACLEFVLVLALVAFIEGARVSLGASTTNFAVLLDAALQALPSILPIAAAAAFFLSMFGFERRVHSRAAGWLGLVLVGTLLFSTGLALRRLPLLGESWRAADASKATLVLQAPGRVIDRGGLLLWYRSVDEAASVRDAVAVDFRLPFPRLSYAASAPLRRDGSELEIGGLNYTASLPRRASAPLFPELRLLPGPSIRERFARLWTAPFLVAAAAMAGFVLLASGFRFLARLTRWPLANAFFAVAGILGFLALDAALSGPVLAPLGVSLAAGAGISLPASEGAALVAAAAEGLIGIVLGAADLALAPRERRVRGD